MMIDEELQKELKKNKFIVIGEFHGVKENITIIKNFLTFFFQQKIPINFAMEWPKDLTKEINKYLKGKIKLNWRSWKFSTSPDGRISKEHLGFIRWLKKRKINFYCIDEGSPKNETWAYWNDRDKKMAKNIMKIKKDKIIVLMGRLHSRTDRFKSKFISKTKFNNPAGYYLPKNKTLSICLRYAYGKTYNCGIKNINDKIKKPKNDFLIRKLRKKGYDYEIIIKHAHPVTILN